MSSAQPASASAERDFKEAVKAYIDIHDQLAAASKELRDVRKKKAELADVILRFMKANDIGECTLQDGKLVRRESKRLEPLKKEHILGELSKTVGESEAESILLGIFNKRTVNSKDTLSRTRNRGSS